jgi:hypothetical protein
MAPSTRSASNPKPAAAPKAASKAAPKAKTAPKPKPTAVAKTIVKAAPKEKAAPTVGDLSKKSAAARKSAVARMGAEDSD